jgi:ubiquinone/menaquinone biosynthesis C-methylase UbiE
MTNYSGRYAELYDLFYADKPYADEARFVHDCIGEFGPPQTREVLELACGTGRHAFELKKFGYQITATDRSPDMLEIARRRFANNGITFIAGDMRELRLPARQYDAVICLFDSIGYLQTDDALRDAFRRIRSHLRVAGLFIFEFWHAPAMLSQYSPMRVRNLKTANGEIVRTSETTLDRKNCLAKVNYTVEERNRDGTHSTIYESHTNRFFSVDEMKLFISEAKFEPVRFFAGFNKTDLISDATWHVVSVVRKT